jgi:hypothetical protein
MLCSPRRRRVLRGVPSSLLFIWPLLQRIDNAGNVPEYTISSASRCVSPTLNPGDGRRIVVVHRELASSVGRIGARTYRVSSVPVLPDSSLCSAKPRAAVIRAPTNSRRAIHVWEQLATGLKVQAASVRVLQRGPAIRLWGHSLIALGIAGWHPAILTHRWIVCRFTDWTKDTV